MDSVIRTLPAPLTTPRDICAGLMNIDAFNLALIRECDALQSRLNALVSGVTDLREILVETVKEKPSELQVQETGLTSPCPGFLWRLQPSEPIPASVCKNKRIVLGFRLEAIGEASLETEEELTFVTQVLNSSKSRIITSSLNGDPILSGGVGKASYNSALNSHTAQIKFRLNEVSSHFEEGCVTLRFQAMCPSNMELQRLIEPYVVEGIVIRAKELTCRKDRSRWRKLPRSSLNNKQ